MQALVYLAQGWSLGLRGEPLFPELHHAWSTGPVSSHLFKLHRRDYSVTAWPFGNAERLTAEEAVIVDSVVRQYGALFGAQLQSLSLVCGPPWVRARGEHGTGLIPLDEIRDHFTSALRADRA
ncbi:Panacea domain-containing protein [Pseudoclavibacter sp. VKM Ac-2888]|uniref:Panacea domain-containing protein n=1 Tax=Pseudoclavibacter sp. VKM Ac-2888 TaxID=2783830 RepID=UPI001889C822|nr:type II toxin-antitoxin system antitoxin SocA domain-containing protein [Pseudoclavibacter sp. VKM Ac-2888]MBF4549341.1 DUF4065 domain-containing protein [Pseudoclavibacter sp. VKM Ac-2888]